MTPEELRTREFETEFKISASRSSGAGGQNVNKVSTKVELRFSVTDSELITSEEKDIITQKLASRISNDGFFIIVSQASRSQIQNKETVIERFYELFAKALTPVKKRRPTSPSKSSKVRRLDNKRIVSEKKILRKKVE